MNKLLRAGFWRVFHDKLLWIFSAGLLIFSAIVTVRNGTDPTFDGALEGGIFIVSVIAPFFLAAFTSLFIGTDYSDGTIRNKLIVGHSREAIYLSNLILNYVASLIATAAYVLPMLAIGIPIGLKFSISVLSVLLLFGLYLLLLLVMCAIFVMISMLCHNKAVTAIVCILGLILLLVLASVIYESLHAPEFINAISLTQNGIEQTPATPNPNYLTGFKRDAYQFILDILPSGQMLELVQLECDNLVVMLVSDVLWTLVLLGAGITLFRKKDIK